HFNAEEGIYLQERSTLRITGTHIISGNIIKGVNGSVGNSGMLLQSGELLIENNVVEGALDGIKAGAHTSTIVRNNQVLSHNRGIFVLNSPQQLVENNVVVGVDDSRSLGDGIHM